jgi:hypothetical protein
MRWGNVNCGQGQGAPSSLVQLPTHVAYSPPVSCSVSLHLRFPATA